MKGELELILVNGARVEVSLDQLTDALVGQPETVIQLVRNIVERGDVGKLRQLVDAMEIMNTSSAFADFARVRTLEEIAERYPFRTWLRLAGKQYNRASLIEYWTFFTKMARHGWNYQPGNINPTGTLATLWRATGTLAGKMMQAPADYGHLPAILVNNPEQVDKVLNQIADPVAFLEVLVGEAWEDMMRSEKFLSAFALNEEGLNQRGCLASVMICLQV